MPARVSPPEVLVERSAPVGDSSMVRSPHGAGLVGMSNFLDVAAADPYASQRWLGTCQGFEAIGG
jgi:hypothetical protein